MLVPDSFDTTSKLLTAVHHYILRARTQTSFALSEVWLFPPIRFSSSHQLTSFLRLLYFTEINFVKEISAKAHGDGYMSFSSNFWLDFVTVWGVIRLNLEPTQKADCISRIFIPKIDSPVLHVQTIDNPHDL